MHRVLVVEASATLRRVLCKALDAAGFGPVECTDLVQAMRALQTDEQGPIDALLLGWPGAPATLAPEVLQRMVEPALLRIPAVFLVHETDRDLIEYTRTRPASAVVPWDIYHEACDALELLLASAPQNGVGGATREIRVLVVDNAPSVRRYYERLLSGRGYQVEVAASSAEALARINAEGFDLVLVDYRLGSERGDALCRQLKSRPDGGSLHVAAMLSSYLEDAIRDCLEAGALECLFKGEPDALFLARVDALARVAHSQKAVEAERSRLAAILGSVGDGVYGVDHDGRVTFVNEAARRILGIEEESAFVGVSAQAELHPMDTAGYAANGEVYSMEEAYAHGRALGSRETLFRHRSGRLIPVECTVYPLLVDRGCQGSVVAFRDISARKSMEARLRWQASHDPLTELFNRSYFEEQLERELRREPSGRDATGAVLYIDLDQFRYLNDVGGHGAGDRLLVEVANRLRGYFRSRDLIARLDGDEFAVLVRAQSRDQITSVAEGVGRALQDCSFEADGKRYSISAAVGVALLNGSYGSAAEVLTQAEVACQLAKRKGRNHAHVYDAQTDERASQGYDLGWAHRLTAALHEGELRLFYQPIMALSDVDPTALPAEPGRLWSLSNVRAEYYEVLLRLRGENGEMISPQTFVPIAERFNLMPEIDCWVVAQVVEHLGRLRAQGRKDVVLSVNLSAKTLGTPTVLPRIKALLAGTDNAPRNLIFEVTETSGIEDLDAARWFINELRGQGYRFALDDFGTGFSSFSQLKLLPADIVKIDGHFIQGMIRDAIDRSIVTAMNEIAHSLGLQTVAEYVEGAETLRQLLSCGVDYVQGNYVALPAEGLPPAGQERSTPALRLVKPAT
jgi:diguanylate cyclase (GGDEF)-like protein/PAS domain S-box-containing protein